MRFVVCWCVAEFLDELESFRVHVLLTVELLSAVHHAARQFLPVPAVHVPCVCPTLYEVGSLSQQTLPPSVPCITVALGVAAALVTNFAAGINPDSVDVYLGAIEQLVACTLDSQASTAIVDQVLPSSSSSSSSSTSAAEATPLLSLVVLVRRLWLILQRHPINRPALLRRMLNLVIALAGAFSFVWC
jgi:hypothetical protein